METEFQGHKITVTEDLEFRVDGPLFNGETRYGKTFESASAARTAIQDLMKRHEAQERVKLSIPVISERGKPLTITGVHARNYNALGLGGETLVYPPAAWIVAALKEREEARARVAQLSKSIEPYGIKANPYGMRSHEQAVAAIVSDAERKTKAASGRELPGQAA